MFVLGPTFEDNEQIGLWSILLNWLPKGKDKKRKKEKKLPKKQEYYLQLALSFIFRPTTHEGINIDVAFEWAWSDFEILFLLKLKQLQDMKMRRRACNYILSLYMEIHCTHIIPNFKLLSILFFIFLMTLQLCKSCLTDSYLFAFCSAGLFTDLIFQSLGHQCLLRLVTFVDIFILFCSSLNGLSVLLLYQN